MVKKEDGSICKTRSQTFNNKRKNTQPETYIQLKLKIWKKDSHGLFDYETTPEQYVTVTKSIFPFRNNQNKNINKIKSTQKQSKMYICRNREYETQVFYANQQNIEQKLKDHIGICELIATKTIKGVYFKIRSLLRLQHFNKFNNQLKKDQVKKQIIDNNQNLQTLPKKNIQEPQIKVFNPIVCPYIITRKFFKGNTQGYPLKTGKIIKFGRIQYIVVETNTQKYFSSLRGTTNLKDVSGYQRIYEIPKKEQETVKIEQKQEIQPKSQQNAIRCKICLQNQQTEKNILISPCNCKGSCAVIHIGCLKKWINSKVKKQVQGIVQSYNFNRFQCQICKVPFPQIIKMQDQNIEMMGIVKPNKPYLILQSINPPRSSISMIHGREQQRCIHVISCESNTLKIGRGHNCQIRLSDISVSRSHAQIQFNENDFLIKDTQSKFGTLVLFDDEVNLNKKHPVKIQSGRGVYEFVIEKKINEQLNQRQTQSENQLQEQKNQNQNNQMNQ